MCDAFHVVIYIVLLVMIATAIWVVFFAFKNFRDELRDQALKEREGIWYKWP